MYPDSPHRVVSLKNQGSFYPAFESDKSQWRLSMQRVLALEADVLCEGHYGIYRPAEAVRQFIEGQLAENS